MIGAGLLLALAAGLAGFNLQQYFSAAGPVPDLPAHIQPIVKSRSGDALIGALRPGFTLPDMDGVLRDVREWDGRVLVINFWATWCPPCKDEIPEFIRLQERHAAAGLQVVGIAVQTAAEVRGFVAEIGMTYPVLVGLEEVIQVAEDYGNHLGALPYTVIIDRKQRIAFIKRGPLHYPEAEAAITPLL